MNKSKAIKISSIAITLLIIAARIFSHGGASLNDSASASAQLKQLTAELGNIQQLATSTASNLEDGGSINKLPLYPVSQVVDGDTIKVVVAGRKETVRLIGIDTPEVVDPRKPVQCFGREASNKAKELLNGQQVRLENDVTQGERDKYGRLLRYIFLEDGTFFNKLMISEGYAHEYTYESNPYQYQIEFKAAEKRAREGKVGLWGASTCGGDMTKEAVKINK